MMGKKAILFSNVYGMGNNWQGKTPAPLEARYHFHFNLVEVDGYTTHDALLGGHLKVAKGGVACGCIPPGRDHPDCL